jgi:hypothetical protein
MKHFRVPADFLTAAPVAGLSDDAKLAAVYLRVNGHIGATGCYRLPTGYLAADLRLDPRRAEDALWDVADAGIVHYDTAHGGWVFAPGFLTANPIHNPSAGKTIAAEIRTIPAEVSFFGRLIAALEPFAAKLPAGFLDECRARMIPQQDQAEEMDTIAVHAPIIADSLAEAEPEPEVAADPESRIRRHLRSRGLDDRAVIDGQLDGIPVFEAIEGRIWIAATFGIWASEWGPAPNTEGFNISPTARDMLAPLLERIDPLVIETL